jgi:hypothetical protein
MEEEDVDHRDKPGDDDRENGDIDRMRLTPMASIQMLALAALLIVNFAHADELLPLPPDQPAQTQLSGPKETSVHTGPPQCLRWTDGCVSCTRNDIKDKPACSNIGPACQPTEIRCIQSEPSPGTSDGKTP